VNKLGWALIIVGGGLVVYGVVQHLSKPAAEPGDPDYDPQGEYGPDEWEQELLKREQEKPYNESDWGSDTVRKTDPADLNDGV
jgi:hypothetical protein